MEGEMGEKREEQRSLTGQKAEPLGIKFTLFLSGQEKRGKPFDLPDLKTTESALRAGEHKHTLKSCNHVNTIKRQWWLLSTILVLYNHSMLIKLI